MYAGGPLLAPVIQEQTCWQARLLLIFCHLDKPETEVYNKKRKSVAGNGWPSSLVKEVTALWARGGYFLFFAWINKLQTPMMTKQSSKTSDVLIGQPPFLVRSRGKKLPPFKRANRIPFWQRWKIFLSWLPVYHTIWQKAIPTSKVQRTVKQKFTSCIILFTML